MCVCTTVLDNQMSSGFKQLASFPPLNCEVQQFLFYWGLMACDYRCEDGGCAVIHGLSPSLTLGSPFLLHLITRAPALSQQDEEKALSWHGAAFSVKVKVSELWAHASPRHTPTLSFRHVEVLVLVCLPRFYYRATFFLRDGSCFGFSCLFAPLPRF